MLQNCVCTVTCMPPSTRPSISQKCGRTTSTSNCTQPAPQTVPQDSTNTSTQTACAVNLARMCRHRHQHYRQLPKPHTLTASEPQLHPAVNLANHFPLVIRTPIGFSYLGRNICTGVCLCEDTLVELALPCFYVSSETKRTYVFQKARVQLSLSVSSGNTSVSLI